MDTHDGGRQPWTGRKGSFAGEKGTLPWEHTLMSSGAQNPDPRDRTPPSGRRARASAARRSSAVPALPAHRPKRRPLLVAQSTSWPVVRHF